MAKYVIEVQKEICKEYQFSNEEYLKDLFENVIINFKGSSVMYEIGNKWIRIYDRLNNLVLYEFSMLDKKEFINYCNSKGIKFRKKAR